MIKAQTIAEILSLYKKHGWILRRVLLSDQLKKNLDNSLETIFGEVEIISTEKIDGVWFSRISPHGEAWELRRLDDAPFALIEVLETDIDKAERDQILRATEMRMLAAKG